MARSVQIMRRNNAGEGGGCQALEKLITENYARLYNYIYAQLRDRFDAEDAVSETVLAAMNRYGTLRDEEKELAWLFGIARNIVHRYRSKTRFELPMTEEFDLADTEHVPMAESLIQAEEFEKSGGRWLIWQRITAG
jgi:RNA polymerase sigma factor (sigma-70 family)